MNIMEKIYISGNLKISMTLDTLNITTKKTEQPLPVNWSKIVPKSIYNYKIDLKHSKSRNNKQHNLLLKGIYAQFDWKINNTIKKQLSKYNLLIIISSQSLTHCFKKNNKNKTLSLESMANNINSLPPASEYWVSFCCNYKQLKKIYSQYKYSKEKEWKEFCNALKTLPSNHWITQQKNEI